MTIILDGASLRIDDVVRVARQYEQVTLGDDAPQSEHAGQGAIRGSASNARNVIAMVNSRVHPVIPERGSVDASSDLAPLAHLALVMVGEGYAEYMGKMGS